MRETSPVYTFKFHLEHVYKTNMYIADVQNC